MTTGVYQIRNTINGHFYVGSTGKRFRRRKRTHFSALRKNKHYNYRLQNAWNKYGEEAFVFEVLQECPPESCIEQEQYYIDSMKPEYNINPTAGNSLGTKHTDETRLKLKESSSKRRGHKKRMDMVGKKYGWLTVVSFVGEDKWGQGRWLCKCKCGKEKTVTGGLLRNGNTTSCGCFRKSSRLC